MHLILDIFKQVSLCILKEGGKKEVFYSLVEKKENNVITWSLQ